MVVVLVVLASIVALLVLIYFIEPFIYALFLSWIIELFVKNPPFVDINEHFPEGRILKENWKVIRAELETLLVDIDAIPQFHEVDKLQRLISAKDNVAWRTFIIKGFDQWIQTNCERVPKTVELLKQMPQVSFAMFSIIDGGKHIPPHIGFFKSVLRYHLGMIIPKGDVFIKVGGQEYRWKEGEDVLFDDTYKHEVWNKTSERRVVLFCDVLRKKGLPVFLQKLNKSMFKLLVNSRKLREAARNAEVAKNIN